MTNGTFAAPPKLYNAVKYLVLIALPAFATAYNALGDGLNLPAVAKVTLVCTVVAAFLGTLVGISARSYNNSEERFDGAIEINANDPSLLHGLDLDQIDPKELLKRKAITLRVDKNHAKVPDPKVD